MNIDDNDKPEACPDSVRPGTGANSAAMKPEAWDDFFALYATTDVPEDYITEADRNQGTYDQALRVEIEQAIMEADDPNTEWVSHAEAVAEWATKRAALKSRIDDKLDDEQK